MLTHDEAVPSPSRPRGLVLIGKRSVGRFLSRSLLFVCEWQLFSGVSGAEEGGSEADRSSGRAIIDGGVRLMVHLFQFALADLFLDALAVETALGMVEAGAEGNDVEVGGG